MVGRTVQIGLIGMGTVGTGVVRGFLERGGYLLRRSGVSMQLRRICDHHANEPHKGLRIDRSMLTTDVKHVLTDPEIDIVIELIGGIHPAKEYLLEAIRRGKHVVTANKALLAEEGEAIFRAARQHRRLVFFEGSVGGGIPIVKALREGLIANRIESIYGIINGTTNYILSTMDQMGYDLRDALGDAQRHGYAEKNPRLDLEGIDTAHKLAILVLLAFGRRVPLNAIHVEGITQLSGHDIRYARQLGYCVKLLAIAKRAQNRLEVRVHPTLLPSWHPLAAVNGVYNAILVRGDMTGDQLFYGRGAGQMPTASAVLADTVQLAQQIIGGHTMPPLEEERSRGARRLKPMLDICSRYYIRCTVTDHPGVLAQIARILGRHHISIASVIQQERQRARSVPIVLMTHDALERDLRLALRQIDRLPIARQPSVAIRMEEL